VTVRLHDHGDHAPGGASTERVLFEDVPIRIEGKRLGDCAY
jgi:hypothetical protein